MKSFLKLILCGLVFVPIALAGASFNGIDKIGNFLVVHFSTGDVQVPLATGGVIVGTASTSNNTTSSASFATLSTSPTVTITPLRTIKYKISFSGVMSNGSGATAQQLRIQPTTGSPTTVFSQEAYTSFTQAGAETTVYAWRIDTLTAGTTYTYSLQGLTSSGTMGINCTVARATNGCAILAEPIY